MVKSSAELNTKLRALNSPTIITLSPDLTTNYVLDQLYYLDYNICIEVGRLMC